MYNDGFLVVHTEAGCITHQDASQGPFLPYLLQQISVYEEATEENRQSSTSRHQHLAVRNDAK